MGYTTTSQHRARSYLNLSIVSSLLYGSLTGGRHLSDSELCNVTGRGQFFPPVQADPAPLQSLREVVRAHRLLLAFPIAVLRGFVFRCFICGSRLVRLWADACLKANRFRLANDTSNTVFWFPNAALLDARLVDAAVQELRSCREDRTEPCCPGVTGVTQLRAAAERPSRKALDVHGMYACTCGHGCCESSFEMRCPESVSGHQTFALTYAAMRASSCLLNDTMCTVMRHLMKLGLRDLEPVLRAFSGLKPEDAPVGSLSVQLSVAEGPFAVFRFDPPAASGGERAADVGRIDRRVPSEPSHFDPAELVLSHIERLRGHSGSSYELTGAIPALHARFHQCWAALGTPATPGVGSGHEKSEQLNAETFSRYGPAERTKTATNFRLSTGTMLALFNQKKALDVAHQFVVLHIRAIMSLSQKDTAFQDLKLQYTTTNPGADVSDTTMGRLSLEARRLAAQNMGHSEAASGASTDRFRMKLAIKARQLAGVIRVLKGIRRDAESGGSDAAKDAMVITDVSTSVIKLPRIGSFKQLQQKIVSQSQSLHGLQRRLEGFIFNPNSAIELHLSQLHDLSVELSRTNILIELHVASRGVKDASSAALYKARGAILKKLEGVHGLLKRLLPLSPEDSVKNFKLPSINSIVGPESLPSTLGTIVVIPGDVALSRLIEAFNARRGAVEELEFLRDDATKIVGNIDAVIELLSSMLALLSLDKPDMTRGAGPSGLWGGPAHAMFDLSRVQMSSADECSFNPRSGGRDGILRRSRPRDVAVSAITGCACCGRAR